MLLVIESSTWRLLLKVSVLFFSADNDQT